MKNFESRVGYRTVLALVALLGGCAAAPEGLRPVQGFAASRYLGEWHEIARLDHRFERGLVAVTAEYLKRDDGGIEVRNRGWDCEDQAWSDVQGRAYLVGAPEVGQLEVTFFWPFYASYNIIALDPDYRFSMVAGSTRSSLWILARDPQLPKAELEALVAQAKSLGFATEQLIYPGRVEDCPRP